MHATLWYIRLKRSSTWCVWARFESIANLAGERSGFPSSLSVWLHTVLLLLPPLLVCWISFPPMRKWGFKFYRENTFARTHRYKYERRTYSHQVLYWSWRLTDMYVICILHTYIYICIRLASSSWIASHQQYIHL